MNSLPLFGLRVVTNEYMVERVQFSRSPARAKRRAKKGHPQHFIDRPKKDAIIVGDTIVVHPSMLTKVLDAMREKGMVVR